jgi:predicted nucleotidyltransferase
MVRPLKRAGRGNLFRPLDAVFGAPSHVAILRALDGSDAGLTGRQVARAAGIAPRAALQGLERLSRARLVRRVPAGRAHFYSLDRRLPLVSTALAPLFEFERSRPGRVYERVRAALRGRALAAALFGSTARGEERPGSDLDLCVVVENGSGKERLRPVLDRLVDVLAEEGILAAPLLLTRRELREEFRAGHPFHRNLVRDAFPIFGRRLEDMVR